MPSDSKKENTVTFEECLLECFNNAEFRNQFNRLTGCSLGVDRRTGMDRAIDKACGHEPPAINDEEGLLFIAFVADAVWSRLRR